ncbi:hypothetical protein [Xanthomonas arboricola]|uniref:hypothetical protein n=1 Tax=Xanthomonas arboricola TaxID=56448 RepID=UPI0011AFDD1D|nr:hypothetical protein [Xanthomonas arboricola]
MKIPYYNKRIELEFEIYARELREHVNSCTNEGEVKLGAQRAYRLFFPLFLTLHCFQSLRGLSHPTQQILLTRMQRLQNKKGFVEALRLPQLPDELHAAVLDSQIEMRFTHFLKEMWSDSLLCLNSIFLCNYRGAYIALRCMLEDLYRHLYYKDHPQEYLDMLEGDAESDHARVAPVALRDYLAGTSYLSLYRKVDTTFKKKTDETEFDLFSMNSQLYSSTSAYVHGSKFISMNAFKDNGSAVRRANEEHELCTTVSKFVKMATAFLLAAHLDDYRRMNEYDKSISFLAFSSDEKHALRRLLNI